MKRIILWLKERASKRRQHNCKVMRELITELNNEISRGYWSADISERMKKELTKAPYSKFYLLVNDAYKKLK